MGKTYCKPPARLYHATNLAAYENMKATGVMGLTRDYYMRATEAIAEMAQVDLDRLVKALDRRNIIDPWDPGVSFYPHARQCWQIAEHYASIGGEYCGFVVTEAVKSAARLRKRSIKTPEMQEILKEATQRFAGVRTPPVVIVVDTTKVSAPLMGGGTDGNSEWYTEEPINAVAIVDLQRTANHE